MIGFLLSNWKLVLLALLIAAVGIQTTRITLLKSEYAQEKAERQAADALERARIAHNAQEAVDALQARLNSVATRYKRLRQSGGTPSLAEATGIPQSCPGEPSKPNPAVERLGVLEREIEAILKFGDDEIAKFVELWKLQQKNAGAVPVQ